MVTWLITSSSLDIPISLYLVNWALLHFSLGSPVGVLFFFLLLLARHCSADWLSSSSVNVFSLLFLLNFSPNISLYNNFLFTNFIIYVFHIIYIYIFLSLFAYIPSYTIITIINNSPLTLSLSLSLSLSDHPSQSFIDLDSPLDCIWCPHRADFCKSWLVGQYWSKCVQVWLLMFPAHLFLSYLDGWWDERQVAVQLVFCGVLLPKFVKKQHVAFLYIPI